MAPVLPQDALVRLAEMLMFERKGKWPEQITHWKVVFLSKAVKSQGQIAGLGDIRPISVGPTIYRLWATIRLSHCQEWLQGLTCNNQGGFVKVGVQDPLIAMEQVYSPGQWSYGATLDLSKAFDSTDWTLAVQFLRHAGVCWTL